MHHGTRAGVRAWQHAVSGYVDGATPLWRPLPSLGWAAAVSGCVAVACSGLTTPSDPAMSGTYVLVRIDGQALPAAVPLPAVYGSCVPQVLFGQLGIGPKIGSRYPLYSILIRADPQAPPANCKGQYGSESPEDVVRDGGRWTGDRLGLRFASQLGAGTYAVQVGDANGSPTLTAMVRGHTLVFQRAWTSDTEPMGLVIDVGDSTGAPVKRSVVAVSQRGLVVARGLEFGSGIATAVTREPATVTVTPAPGYTVAPGQAASVTVTPPAGARGVSVRFVLVRAP